MDTLNINALRQHIASLLGLDESSFNYQNICETSVNDQLSFSIQIVEKPKKLLIYTLELDAPVNTQQEYLIELLKANNHLGQGSGYFFSLSDNSENLLLISAQDIDFFQQLEVETQSMNIQFFLEKGFEINNILLNNQDIKDQPIQKLLANIVQDNMDNLNI